MLHKFFLSASVLSLFFVGKSQQVFDFENLTLPSGNFWNGSDNSGSFGNSDLSFLNNYDETYASWYGFAYSSLTDVSTEGYENQYSTYAGVAKSGMKFGIAYVGTDWQNSYATIPSVCTFVTPTEPKNVFVTNATFTALEVLKSGGYSQFSEGDWFKLVIEGKNQNLSTGIVEYYLIDFRNSLTFVENTWHNIDLSELGTVSALEFHLESSDTGDYGINTPTYFCLDDLTYDIPTKTDTKGAPNCIVSPNPSSEFIQISNFGQIQNLNILDISGRVIMSNIQTETVSVSDLTRGLYFLTYIIDGKIESQKFSKF